MKMVGCNSLTAWIRRGLMLVGLSLCLGFIPAVGVSAYGAQVSVEGAQAAAGSAEAAAESAGAAGEDSGDDFFFLMAGGLALIVLFVVTVAVSTVISCIGAGVGAGEIE